MLVQGEECGKWNILVVSEEDSPREKFVQGTQTKTLLNLKLFYFL